MKNLRLKWKLLISYGIIFLFILTLGITSLGLVGNIKTSGSVIILSILILSLLITIIFAFLMLRYLISPINILERDLSRVFFTKTFAVIYEFIFFNFLIKDRQTSVNLNFHVIKENLKRSKLKLV